MDTSGFTRIRYEQAAKSGKGKAEYLAALERAVGMELTKSMEVIAARIIDQLNQEGHNLVRMEDEILAFGDNRSEDEPSLVVDIMATCGVSVTDEIPEPRQETTEERWFFQMADRIFEKYMDQGYDTLTPDEKIFHDVDQLDREVNNGGFAQYFSNSAGQNAHQALAALTALGARKSAMLLSDAIALFPGKIIPQDDGERMKAVEQVETEQPGELNKLDDLYYGSAEDLLVLLYIHGHGGAN
ncbi:MAG: DMP19 family protein [Nitrospinota bacterium]|nr:DMP19 family protein [Nitrospinota bacterium]